MTRAQGSRSATSIRIRDFVGSDRPFLEAGLISELRDEAPFDPLKIVVPPRDWGRTHSTWLLKQVRDRSGHLLLAIVGRRRAGFVIGALERASPRRRRFEPARPCSIFALFVLPEFRRAGVGNQLMTEMERRFRAQRRDFVHLIALSGNAPALQLYRARGYAERVLFLGKWMDPAEGRGAREPPPLGGRRARAARSVVAGKGPVVRRPRERQERRRRQ